MVIMQLFQIVDLNGLIGTAWCKIGHEKGYFGHVGFGEELMNLTVGKVWDPCNSDSGALECVAHFAASWTICQH